MGLQQGKANPFTNGRLANRGLTSLVKETTVCQAAKPLEQASLSQITLIWSHQNFIQPPLGVGFVVSPIQIWFKKSGLNNRFDFETGLCSGLIKHNRVRFWNWFRLWSNYTRPCLVGPTETRFQITRGCHLALDKMFGKLQMITLSAISSMETGWFCQLSSTFVTLGVINDKPSLVGVASNKRQAIIFTKDDPSSAYVLHLVHTLKHVPHSLMDYHLK